MNKGGAKQNGQKFNKHLESILVTYVASIVAIVALSSHLKDNHNREM